MPEASVAELYHSVTACYSIATSLEIQVRRRHGTRFSEYHRDIPLILFLYWDTSES